MGKTFKSIEGDRYRVDTYNGVECDTDIITNEVTGYYVCYDGEPLIEISEEVYKALDKYYKENKF